MKSKNTFWKLISLKLFQLAIIALVSIYIWYIDFIFFENRGFGYDHHYYKKLLISEGFGKFFITYISEGATEPISAVFFYALSNLAGSETLKFFLAREIIFLLFIYRFHKSNKIFIFGILLYLTPLMQTLFQSNLRQGLAIAILVFLLPIWRNFTPFLLGTLSHLSISFLLILRIFNQKKILLFSSILMPLLIFLVITLMPDNLLNTLNDKLEARMKITEIQNLGYFFHLFLILLIYLFLTEGRNDRLNSKKVYITSVVFLFFVLCIPLNNVPQRLIPLVWLLPIYDLCCRDTHWNYKIPISLLSIYFILMWLKTLLLASSN